MSEIKTEGVQELRLDEMSQVQGGYLTALNTGIDGVNGALRAEPRKSSRQIGSIKNGSVVDVYKETLTRDPESGRNFVQIQADGKIGWVAASFVGLPR